VGSKEKPVRKAEVDEIVELVEGPKKDTKSGLERVKVKALRDGEQGWVTVKGNQGKQFLEETEKPFYSCLKDVVLETQLNSAQDSSIRTLKTDEVVELVGGPRLEQLGSVMRMRVKAKSQTGWITCKDGKGTELTEKDTKSYVCTATVAMTDLQDIKDCKVLRKMAVDEAFTLIEGPVTEENGMTRVKGKSAKDDKEGWITIKGNAGTTYAKCNEKLYTIKQTVSLQQKFASDSTTLGDLAAGETFDLLEGPREETPAPLNRIQVRTKGDAVVGWISMRADSVRVWTPFHKFLKSTPLYTSKGLKDSVVREVNPGEVFEVLDGPVEAEGSMWLKGRTKKDGSVGWTTVKNAEGAALLGH